MLSTPIAVLLTLISLYFILSSRRSLKGAQWAVVVGFVLSTIWHILYVYNFAAYKYTFPFPFAYLFLTGIFLSTPLSMLVYVAMRFKEILGEVRENARRVVQLSEEKKQQALNQQKLLEEEVARQTLELRTALQNLKATQQQLIQQEKMASLGELTAGIAHEIQNPLNFVNNFSEANRELLQELETEAKNGNVEVVLHIAADLKTNEERIALHGKRAEAIVKSMMEHSKSTKGVKQSTDINALVEEYLKLAYHGFRAKHPSFSAVLETHYDPGIGKIEVVAQDISRVLLNIFNNAFYAVCKKKEQSRNSFEPLISISTEKVGSAVVITVKDNGTGIPEKVKEKIYQPFFTTKPTGEGTGLGLSLSYDIITKGHGGNLTVQSTEGEGTEFIINLKGKEV
jgi:signal transduction histidine kinase